MKRRLTFHAGDVHLSSTFESDAADVVLSNWRATLQGDTTAQPFVSVIGDPVMHIALSAVVAIEDTLA